MRRHVWAVMWALVAFVTCFCGGANLSDFVTTGNFVSLGLGLLGVGCGWYSTTRFIQELARA